MAHTVRVKALRAFYDRRAHANRHEGEVFDVTAERLASLNACGPEQGGAPLVAEFRKGRR